MSGGAPLVLALFTLAGAVREGRPPPRISRLDACAGAAGAAGADSLVPALFELRLGRIASRTVTAFRSGDEALVPLSPLFEMAEIRFRLEPAGRFHASLQPGNVSLIIDAVTRSARIGDRSLSVPAGHICFESGELYLVTSVLATVLGLDFDVSWSDLTVTLADPTSLPAALRLTREAARERLRQRATGSTVPDLTLGLARPPIDGFVLDYSLGASSSPSAETADATVAFGADVFGGSLEASTGTGERSSGARTLASWAGVWRERRWLKQLHLGDGIVTGPQWRPIRGVALTNSPYLRPSLFGVSGYAGRLEPGWQIEAYRGGELIAFGSTDELGRFALDLPVLYGENPVDLIMYGPFGEVRRISRNERVLGELLRPRQFEYGISGGRCATRAAHFCESTGNVDFRYGVSPRLTARVGGEAFRQADARTTHPYVGVQASAAGGAALELTGVARAFARSRAYYEPSINLRLFAEYTRFSSGEPPRELVPVGRRQQWIVSGFYRPAATEEWLFLEGGADRIESTAGRTMHTRLGASLQGDEMRLLPYVRTEHDRPALGGPSDRGFVGINSFFLPRLKRGSILGRSLLRFSAEAEDGRKPRSAGVSMTRPFAFGSRLEMSANWARGGRGFTFGVTLSRDLSTVRSYTTLTKASGARATATQLAQGSVIWNRPGRSAALVPGPSLQRAGVTGRVFLDNNVNGRLDAGDAPLSRAYVRVGSTGGDVDSTGWFRIWDVVPFEPVLITVDSLSLESPLWVPATTTVSLEPGPNRFRMLDIPIVPGGVVEGRVVLPTAGGQVGVGGARVTFANARTHARRTEITFNDGDFSAIAVKPGEYHLTVDEKTLTSLNAAIDTTTVTVMAEPEGARVTGVKIVLKPLSPPLLASTDSLVAPPDTVISPPDSSIAKPALAASRPARSARRCSIGECAPRARPVPPAVASRKAGSVARRAVAARPPRPARASRPSKRLEESFWKLGAQCARRPAGHYCRGEK